jgi:tRNA(Ile)-lysidine synthase TilS/MesJ
MKKLLSLTRAAIEKYNMISEGDKIAVGVSGGKDSVALLCALAKLRAFYPVKFDIVAVTLDYRFNDEDGNFEPVKELCRELDVEYVIKPTNLWKVIFEERK